MMESDSAAFPLRPCAFCGSTRTALVELDREGRQIHFAWCEDCYAQGPRAEDRLAATALWNRRPALPGARAALPPPDDLAEHEKEMSKIVERFLKGKEV